MSSISSKVGSGKQVVRVGASSVGLIALNVLALSCSTPGASDAPEETLGSAKEAIHDPNEPLCMAPTIDTSNCCPFSLPNSIDPTQPDDVYSGAPDADFYRNVRAKMPLYAPHGSPFTEDEVFVLQGWYRTKDGSGNRSGHGAIDYVRKNITTDASWPVRAVADGTVVTVTYDNKLLGSCCGMGNTVVIEHTAPTGEKYRSIYAHLRNGATNDCQEAKDFVAAGVGVNDRYRLFVEDQTNNQPCTAVDLDDFVWGDETTTLQVAPGDEVKAGDIIAMAGNTGQGGIQAGLDPSGNLTNSFANVHLHLFFMVHTPEFEATTGSPWSNTDPYGAYAATDGEPPGGNCYVLGANVGTHRLFAPFYPTFAGVKTEHLAHYFDHYPSMGYAAQTMSIYPSNAEQLSAGSFQPGLSPEWISKIGRFRSDFQQDLADHAAQDLQLREIQVSSLQGGDIRYNGIWTRRTASNSNTVIDLDDTTWAATIQGEVNNGRRPTDEFTYQINGIRRHAGVFAADGVPTSAWNIAWGRTLPNYNALVATEQTAGRKPTSASAEPPADTSYGGMFMAAQGDWVVEPNITGGVDGFTARNDFHTDPAQGRRLYRVQGYGNGQTFAAIWVKEERPPSAIILASGATTCRAPGGSATITLDARTSIFDAVFPLGFEWNGPFGLLNGPVQTVTLPIGSHTVSLRAWDSRGLQSLTSQQIDVLQDVTGPVLTPPPPLTITTCTNVNLGTATAVDACGGSVMISNNAPSTFPLGTTTVTWTARDQFGNITTATQLVTANLGDSTTCCPAGTNVIQGDSNNNNLNGTGGSDCILGKGGQDIINGNGGNDFISAGDGTDTVNGGSGNDRIYGGPGQDILDGGADTDFVRGGEGDDQCRGGTGNDEIHGDNGQDRIFGDDGNDACFGEDGDDRLEGGAGNDALNGGGLHDTCIGGPGTDTFAVCQNQTQ